MKTNSALVYNTLSQAQTFRDKFRRGYSIARVGRKFVVLSPEQVKKLEAFDVVDGRLQPLSIVDESPKITAYKNFDKWRKAAKRAGCNVRMTTRWANGGGHYEAILGGSVVGFYSRGTQCLDGKQRKLNAGHLHVK